MKKDRMVETYIYEGLGFPIELVNAPMKKVFGEWVLDVNLNQLQLKVLHLLVHKHSPLQAGELRFIRKYFEMTTTAFGEVFGMSHVAVLKWEGGQLPSAALDVYIRMFVMGQLRAKNEEFGKLYHQVSLAELAQSKKRKQAYEPLVLDASLKLYSS